LRPGECGSGCEERRESVRGVLEDEGGGEKDAMRVLRLVKAVRMGRSERCVKEVAGERKGSVRRGRVVEPVHLRYFLRIFWKPMRWAWMKRSRLRISSVQLCER
jgi:hypothetical protein